MTSLKNVALVGASGSLGVAVLQAIVKSGKFEVTAIKRTSSKSTFPPSVRVKTADFSSVESIITAFSGQDAVVSTVGTEGLAGQDVLIDAAVKAGVKRFLPSDFGCDLSNPVVAALPVFGYKRAVHKQLERVAAMNAAFSYTLVCNNAFLDWGLDNEFLLNWRSSKPKLYDGGNSLFSATTLESIGQGVVGVLCHPAETANRFVRIKDIDLTQNQLLDIAKKVAPEKTWESPEHISTAGLVEHADERITQHDYSPSVMYSYIFRAIFGPPEYGSHFAQVDNALLGVNGPKTLADVEAILRSLPV